MIRWHISHDRESELAGKVHTGSILNFNIKFSQLFLFSVIVIMVLPACNITRENTKLSADNTPIKILRPEDLPAQVRERIKPPSVLYVHLYPDERFEGDTLNTLGEKLKEGIILNLNKPEVEKQENNKLDNVIQNAETTFYYDVVSGSFRNKLNAESFAENMKKDGYDKTFVIFDNGLHRVVVQRYTTEIEARRFLQKYRSENPENSDTWLYYKKN